MRVVFVLAETYQQARTWWHDNAPAESQPHFRFASDGGQLLGRRGEDVELIVLPRAERHPRYGEVLAFARGRGAGIRWEADS